MKIILKVFVLTAVCAAFIGCSNKSEIVFDNTLNNNSGYLVKAETTAKKVEPYIEEAAGAENTADDVSSNIKNKNFEFAYGYGTTLEGAYEKGLKVYLLNKNNDTYCETETLDAAEIYDEYYNKTIAITNLLPKCEGDFIRFSVVSKEPIYISFKNLSVTKEIIEKFSSLIVGSDPNYPPMVVVSNEDNPNYRPLYFELNEYRYVYYAVGFPASEVIYESVARLEDDKVITVNKKTA